MVELEFAIVEFMLCSLKGGTRVRVATLLPWRVFGDFHDAFAFQ